VTELLIGTPTLDDPTIVDDRRRHHAPHRVREWMAGGRCPQAAQSWCALTQRLFSWMP
jgi:hypothetical protein